MNNKFRINIIIATSKKRTNLLINRALKSVYSQKDINGENINVIIVDDNLRISENKFSEEYEIIKNRVYELRSKLNLKENEYKTFVIRNTKKQFFSGTGAWNTGIEFIKEQRLNKISFTAILDDDDEYKNNYLHKCLENIDKNTLAVFAPIIWREKELERIHYIKKMELTPRHFFIGNPGVQGSNMFFRSEILEEIGGFDENLPSTTDRDLMIRFLDHIEKNYHKSPIVVLEEPLIIHYADGKDRVTDDKIKKKQGLDLFYKKYRHRFSKADFIKSLERAKQFFNYEYEG